MVVSRSRRVLGRSTRAGVVVTTSKKGACCGFSEAFGRVYKGIRRVY